MSMNNPHSPILALAITAKVQTVALRHTLNALGELRDCMSDKYDNASNTWQDSPQGERYFDALDHIDNIIEAAEELDDKLIQCTVEELEELAK